RIVAILNGTSNAVLSRMEGTGCTVPHAVADAKACGYAEADPSADLDGIDARAKLAILCALGFRLRVDPARIETRSIAHLQPADVQQVHRHRAAIVPAPVLSAPSIIRGLDRGTHIVDFLDLDRPEPSVGLIAEAV